MASAGLLEGRDRLGRQSVTEHRQESGPVDGGEVIVLHGCPVVVHVLEHIRVFGVLEQSRHGIGGQVFAGVAALEPPAPVGAEVLLDQDVDKEFPSRLESAFVRVALG